jgi:hypothetical protein
MNAQLRAQARPVPRQRQRDYGWLADENSERWRRPEVRAPLQHSVAIHDSCNDHGSKSKCRHPAGETGLVGDGRMRIASLR